MPCTLHLLSAERRSAGLRVDAWSAITRESVFQNDVRHAEFGRVGNRKGNTANAQTSGNLGRDSVQPQRRLAARQVRDLEVFPRHAALPTGADGLHAGLFRGETRGVAFEPVGLALHVSDLSWREDTIDKA